MVIFPHIFVSDCKSHFLVLSSWSQIKAKFIKQLFEKKTELTLAVQRRSSEITVRDIDGSREIAEVSEGVNVSLWAGGMGWSFPELPFIPFLKKRKKWRHIRNARIQKITEEPEKEGEYLSFNFWYKKCKKAIIYLYLTLFFALLLTLCLTECKCVFSCGWISLKCLRSEEVFKHLQTVCKREQMDPEKAQKTPPTSQ